MCVTLPFLGERMCVNGGVLTSIGVAEGHLWSLHGPMTHVRGALQGPMTHIELHKNPTRFDLAPHSSRLCKQVC